MYSSTFLYCGRVVIGPTWVASSSGSPIRAVRASASRRSVNSSMTVLWISAREPAMQVWPVAAKMPETTPLTASSSTASSNTMLADLPPSSRVTGLIERAADS